MGEEKVIRNNIKNVNEGEVERYAVLQLTKESDAVNTESVVSKEQPLTIIVNNEELVTLLCSPNNIDYLAVGFLSSELFIQNKDEIRKILIDAKRGIVRLETRESLEFTSETLHKRLITSGCGRGAAFYSTADIGIYKVLSRTKISPSKIFNLVDKFQHRSKTYLSTHGVHSAALCNKNAIVVFNEDIGRHNAIDKIFGECILQDIPMNGGILISSGRITSEIMHKVAKKNIPILISISAPTNLGVELAENFGVTLISSVRGGKARIYSHAWRVSIGKKTSMSSFY